jgi:hypothetical protein
MLRFHKGIVRFRKLYRYRMVMGVEKKKEAEKKM